MSIYDLCKQCNDLRSLFSSSFLLADTLRQQMDSRFSSDGLEISQLLLLVPSCIVTPRWRQHPEEYIKKMLDAAKHYRADLGDAALRYETELHVWRDHW
jgi:hypothetical protein